MKAVSRAIKAALFPREGLKICAKELKGEGTPPVTIDEAGPYGRFYSAPA